MMVALNENEMFADATLSHFWLYLFSMGKIVKILN